MCSSFGKVFDHQRNVRMEGIAAPLGGSEACFCSFSLLVTPHHFVECQLESGTSVKKQKLKKSNEEEIKDGGGGPPLLPKQNWRA